MSIENSIFSEKEIKSLREAQKLLEPLSDVDIPQEILRPRVESLMKRFQKISEILPNISGINFIDEKKREWNLDWNKDKTGRIYMINAVRRLDGVAEAHNIFIGGAANEASVQYTYWGVWTEHSIFRDSEAAIVPTEMRFDQFLIPLEKALGISVED
jgi:hypothetical protein